MVERYAGYLRGSIMGDTRGGCFDAPLINKLNNNRAAGKALMVSKKPGVVGFAHELLDYDPKIDIAIKFVLRNTLIVMKTC